MTFSRLYEFAAQQTHAPVILEGVVDAEIIRLTAQDRILYTPVELDREVCYGLVKQYRLSNGVYDQDPEWITEVRYDRTLNMCWRRFVCCKELMHVFDSESERTDSSEKFSVLLDQLETEPLDDDKTPMYISENRTKWMALAILCPIPFRDYFRPRWESGEMSDYDVALELRIPEGYVQTIMKDYFPDVVGVLTAG